MSETRVLTSLSFFEISVVMHPPHPDWTIKVGEDD